MTDIYYGDEGVEVRLELIVLILVGISIALTSGCYTVGKPVNTPENRAIITDSDGRQWDVTHARDVYHMNPDYYNYGIGIGAIPSVDNPAIVKVHIQCELVGS